MNPSRRYDAIVAGLGGMGSAALHQLARRGMRVLGIERFGIPNEFGSSHGLTRIIRLAYYEHPSYVSLLRRAYELWWELQREAGEQLLHITGSIDAGPPGSIVFEGSRRSCEEHGLQHEVLTSAELTRRFPGYRLPPQHLALLQPEGGFLLPERCIVAHVTAGQRSGAEVHVGERITRWESTSRGVQVGSDRATYEAASLLLTTGAWMSSLEPSLESLAVPERQVLAWFQPVRPELFAHGRFPVFNLLVDEGRYYGFPIFGIPGFKVGRYHHFEEHVDADLVDRQCRPADEELLRSFTQRYFPDAAGPALALKVCLFTNSPDEHFIIDRHPEHPEVIIAAGFSGHGFKFASVVGEILADLAINGATDHDISLFRLKRFQQDGLKSI